MPQGNNDEGLVGYRWRYVHEGAPWHLRRTPIYATEADQWFCATEVEAVYSAARIEALLRTQADAERSQRFLDAIKERTPTGQWIAVQYHPDGDWSVANAPLADDRKRIGELEAAILNRIKDNPTIYNDAFNNGLRAAVAVIRASLSKPLSDGE